MPDPHPAFTVTALSFEQTRVLGCLLEKEALVPDTYPLTFNSLLAACNQTTNRDPVTSLDDAAVTAAIDGLRQTGWVFQLSQAGARVPKFKHNLHDKISGLDRPAVALLCTLLLRGHQTAGELRQRCERMHAFPDLASVESELESLMDHAEGPLVTCLPSGSGRRVAQYAHLFSGPVDPGAVHAMHAAPAVVVPPPEDWRLAVETRLAALESAVADLRAQLGLAG
jgi:uncharacterized protein YceH (UPF0502 family)